MQRGHEAAHQSIAHASRSCASASSLATCTLNLQVRSTDRRIQISSSGSSTSSTSSCSSESESCSGSSSTSSSSSADVLDVSSFAPFLPKQALSFVSWNARSIFGATYAPQASHKANYEKLVSLCTRHDIVCIQEARGSEAHLEYFCREVYQAFGVGTFLDSTTSGGCIIFVHPRLQAHFTHAEHHIIENGRIHSLTLINERECMQIINIHIEHSHRPVVKQAQLRRIRRAVHPAARASIYILGDFNFLARGEGSYHRDGRVITSGISTAKEFDRLFPNFAEVDQASFTHRVEGWREERKFVESLSRLDRIYTSIPPGDLRFVPCFSDPWDTRGFG